MKSALTLLTAALTLTLTPLAAAQGVLNVATGAAGGTYATMFKNMGEVCTNASFLRELHSTGSIENLDDLLSNKASLAFVQLDVLKARAQIDHDPRTAQIRVLASLHHEELHLIALHQARTGGVLGIGSKLTGPLTFADLKGQTIGSWGGSVITARVLAAQSGVPYNVTSFNDRDAALSALRNHQVSAVLAVVGQPASWMNALDPATYALLPIPAATVHPNFYTPANLVYSNFGSSVPTLSVQSVLATRDFKTPEKKAQLLKYRDCLARHLTGLQEQEGMHPKWQDVTSLTGDSGWPAYK